MDYGKKKDTLLKIMKSGKSFILINRYKIMIASTKLQDGLSNSVKRSTSKLEVFIP